MGLVLSQGVGGGFVRLYLKVLVELKPILLVLLDGDGTTGVENGGNVVSVVMKAGLEDGLEDTELLGLYVFSVLENKEYDIVSAELGAGVLDLDEYEDESDALGVGVNTGDEDALGKGTGSEKVLLSDE